MNSILKRELKGYFDSPIAYIFIIVFLLITCGLYMSSFFLMGRLEIRSFFTILPFILIVFMPAITMRLWAEEKRLGTFELLMTLPVKTRQITLYKFLAGFIFYSIALLGTIVIPIILWILGGTDPGPVIGGYIGALFIGSFLLSLGIFISGFCKDQIIAFILAMVLSFAFFMLGTNYIAVQIDGWTGSLALGTLLKKYIGMTYHFKSVEKGILDMRDIFYFVSMTLTFLILNALFLEGRMRQGAKKSFTGAATLIIGVVIFTNVVISGFSTYRFDLTENKIYTVSDSAKSILSKLKVPVRLALYITPEEKMPSAMKSLQQDIVDKLEEFKIASGGKLTYEVIDPSSDPTLEESLAARGIGPFQVQSIEQDEIGVKVIYSAISISYLDRKEEIIKAIHIQNLFNLEYEILSKVYRVSTDKKIKIAVYSGEEKIEPALAELYMKMGRPIPESGPKFTMIPNFLREEDYEVSEVDITKESPIPADTDTLLVLAPQNLNERQLYEISRVASKGGNIILAVQNYRYDYAPLGRRGMEVTPKHVAHGINPLLQNYGVTIDDRILMDNSMETLSIPAKQNIGGLFNVMMSTPVKVPTQIKVISQNMNEDISITNSLSMILYAWGSALKIDKKLPEGLELTRLVSSSKESWFTEQKATPLDASDINPPRKFDGSKLLAVMLKGSFKDPYKNKARPLWPGNTEDDPADPAITSAPGKMVIIGAGDMFSDTFIKAGNNGMFILNAVDALSLGDELINIRGKHQQVKLIPKTSPQQKLWFKLLGVLLAPLIILTIGILRYFIRKKSIQNYMILDGNRSI